MIFEEDLPEYEHFMNARRTPAFRERRRCELKQEARASRTLRRYGYCEADLWIEQEASVADELINGLRMTAKEQRGRLENSHRKVDPDTWLWGKDGPDCVAELGREVLRCAGFDAARQGFAKEWRRDCWIIVVCE